MAKCRVAVDLLDNVSDFHSIFSRHKLLPGFRRKYAVLKVVGSGASSIVCTCAASSPPAVVATKFIFKNRIAFICLFIYTTPGIPVSKWTRDKSLGGSVPLEISITASLSHPSIIKFIEWFEDEVFCYLVMESFSSGEMLSISTSALPDASTDELPPSPRLEIPDSNKRKTPLIASPSAHKSLQDLPAESLSITMPRPNRRNRPMTSPFSRSISHDGGAGMDLFEYVSTALSPLSIASPLSSSSPRESSPLVRMAQDASKKMVRAPSMKKRKLKRLSEPQVRDIMKQVTSALSYMHGRCIIHGDIKLENILVNHGLGEQEPSLTVKLIDFGGALVLTGILAPSSFKL